MATGKTIDLAEESKILKAVIVDTTVAGSVTRLDELESLCSTAGIVVTSRMSFNVVRINPSTYIGSGQAQKIAARADDDGAELVVFNMAITPRVQRNLEEEMDLCVIDRQEVILQIFANRAKTKEAVLQVELARLQYSLPRLSGRWANLSQQRGGVRGSKGAGEKQLELDRRIAKDRISRLKKEISAIGQQRLVQRRNRSTQDVVNVAIVGYTNSGKSTLLNKISDAQVLAQNKLFATLDTTTRRVFMPDGRTFLFTDTVGFVSDLPHELVDAFKSTLEEAALADVLLVVLDSSREDILMCWQTTVNVLKSLGAFDKPRLVLLNKSDLCDGFTPLIPGERTMSVSITKAEDMAPILQAVQSLVP